MAFSVSTKGQYAVLVMCELARSDESFTSLTDISRTQKVSQGYLEQIVRPLRENNLVQGKRGFGGGYRLARPADRITLGEIIKVTEGPIAPVQCLHDGFSHSDCPDDCKAKFLWQRVGSAIEGVLNSITLHDLMMEARFEEEEGVQHE